MAPDVRIDLEYLLACPLGRMLTLAKNSRKHQRKSIVLALLDHAFQLKHTNKQRMFHEATVAVVLAAPIRDRELLALSLAHLANACRCIGQLEQAKHYLAQAESLAPASLPTRALLLEFHTSLSLHLGGLDRAASAIAEAIEIRKTLDDRVRLVANYLLQSQVESELSRPVTALSLVNAALPLLEATDDNRLIAHHNACKYILEMNEAPEALARYRALEPLYDLHPNTSTQAARHHLHGQLLLANGLLARGEVAFRSSLSLCVSAGQSARAILVSLDLYAHFRQMSSSSADAFFLESVVPLLRTVDVGLANRWARYRPTLASIQRAMRTFRAAP